MPRKWEKQPGAEAALSHKRLTQPIRKSWFDMLEEDQRRIKRCGENINSDCDVTGLCNNFPKRLADLVLPERGRPKE